jgi:RHS repeat-associated protein
MITSAGTSYYYTTDRLGSVILLSGPGQDRSAVYTYDAWGNTTPRGTQAATNPWTYAGGYNDTASSRIKLGARYYNPYRGRFTQLDPSGQEQNRYLYASANPINNTDLTGLFYLPQFSATVCLFVCLGASAALEWGSGIKFGTTVGIGFRAEAGVSVGGGFGSLGGTSAECTGSAGAAGAYAGLGLSYLGAYGGWAGGIGGGCSIMFGTYR